MVPPGADHLMTEATPAETKPPAESRPAESEGAPRRVPFTLLFATATLILLLLFFKSVADILFLLFISVLFALYLSAITDFLERRLQLQRRYGIMLALLVTLVAASGIGYLIVPPVLAQTQELFAALPALIAQGQAGLLNLLGRYPVLAEILPSPDAVAEPAAGSPLSRIGEYFAGVFPYLFHLGEFLIHLFSVLVMGVYMTLSPGQYRDGFVALFPPVHRDLTRDILDHLSRTLRSWIVGQILAMFFLAVFTWIGLMLLSVPYALAFGVFTGVVAIVPFFGTLVSTILPALFVLGAGGFTTALFVILLGVLIHLIEANFIHPIIMQRQVHLPPVLSILSVLIMAELLGIVGLLVAVPVLATTMVVVQRIYVERILEGRGFRRRIRTDESRVWLPWRRDRRLSHIEQLEQSEGVPQPPAPPPGAAAPEASG